MFKIFETWICIQDLPWPVFFFQGVVTFDEVSSCCKLQIKELGDGMLVGFGLLIHLLESPVMSGLCFSTVLHNNGLCW